MRKVVLCFLTTFILIALMTTTGGCMSRNSNDKDSISNLSFNHDGKKVVFDRCRNEGCQIQVYDLETGELAAYQAPENERWTMGKYSYDGKRITFSVIPHKPQGGLDLGQMQIAVMDADGKNYKKVTTGPGAKLYPTFSHNRKKILYACAARIRESGGTPASNYDAWEVELTTGKQTQLTFYKYFYMGNLTYFPDDERFIFYGDRPSVYEGMRAYPDEEAFIAKMRELNRQGKNIGGVVVMKGKELVVPNPYNKYPPETFAKKPLLSKDGSVMIYEKSHGRFYLYSPDGNHRLAVDAGPSDSAAISPDAELFAMIAVGEIINTFTMRDGKRKDKLYLSRVPKTVENFEVYMRKRPDIHRMIPDKPSIILNK
jgi:Tol biopolymer transport system component